MAPYKVPGENGRRAAGAALLGLLLLAASGPGCGRKEGGPSRAGAVTVPEGPGAMAAAQPESGAALPSRSGDVVVDPQFPGRITPPGVSVKALPGHAAEVVGVLWFVNGSEAESGMHLSPSLYKRGDRIRADVKMRIDGVDTVVKTPETLAGNSPPAVTGVRIEPGNPVAGGTVRAIAEAVDADGDPLKLRFQWHVDGAAVPGDGDTLVLKGVKRGAVVHAKAIPNDGIVDGAWGETPRHQVVNGLPVVKSRVPGEIPADGKFVYRIEAEDPDGDPMTYTLVQGPPGMALTGSTLEWQVPRGYYGQTTEAVVEIADGRDSRTVQRISMTVQPPKQ